MPILTYPVKQNSEGCHAQSFGVNRKTSVKLVVGFTTVLVQAHLLHTDIEITAGHMYAPCLLFRNTFFVKFDQIERERGCFKAYFKGFEQ